MQGVWLNQLSALRRLHLNGPCLEALFCDVEGLPASLEEVSVTVPQGEVTIILDDGSNCLSQPLQVRRSQCRSADTARACGDVGCSASAGAKRHSLRSRLPQPVVSVTKSA